MNLFFRSLLASTPMTENQEKSHFFIFLDFPTGMWRPRKISANAILMSPIELLNRMQMKKESLKKSHSSLRNRIAKYLKWDSRDVHWCTSGCKNRFKTHQSMQNVFNQCRFDVVLHLGKIILSKNLLMSIKSFEKRVWNFMNLLKELEPSDLCRMLLASDWEVWRQNPLYWSLLCQRLCNYIIITGVMNYRKSSKISVVIHARPYRPIIGPRT